MKLRIPLILITAFAPGLTGCKSAGQTARDPDMKSRAAAIYSRGLGQETAFKTGETETIKPAEKARQMLDSSANGNTTPETSIAEGKKRGGGDTQRAAADRAGVSTRQ